MQINNDDKLVEEKTETHVEEVRGGSQDNADGPGDEQECSDEEEKEQPSKYSIPTFLQE